MPMQEFLASYAVQVDEDGARRLQSILDQNREAGAALADVFSSAYSSLAALKRELSDASGMKNVFSALTSGALSPKLPVSSLPDLSAGLQPGLSSSVLSVGADFSEADSAFDDFRARLESERPRISVNTTGITSAVSSAVASIRSMLSSVRVSVPVTAVASLDASGLTASSGSGTSSSGRNVRTSVTAAAFGEGGRIASPTLAVIAEEGLPEYVIPTGNETRAVPLLRSLLRELSASARASALGDFVPSDLSASAREAFLPAGSYPVNNYQSVQAPVTIQVTSSSASPEAVGRSVYDVAQRSLLRTLQGVFV